MKRTTVAASFVLAVVLAAVMFLGSSSASGQSDGDPAYSTNASPNGSCANSAGGPNGEATCLQLSFNHDPVNKSVYNVRGYTIGTFTCSSGRNGTNPGFVIADPIPVAEDGSFNYHGPWDSGQPAGSWGSLSGTIDLQGQLRPDGTAPGTLHITGTYTFAGPPSEGGPCSAPYEYQQSYIAQGPPGPVAACDVYWQKLGSTLTVRAPGFLGNDSDSQGLPLQATVDHTNFAAADHPYRFNRSTGGLWFSKVSRRFKTVITYHVTNSAGASSPRTTITIYVQRHRPTEAQLGACPSAAFTGLGGFRWSMPERYNGKDRDHSGLADYFTPLNYKPFPPFTGDPIHPSDWYVTLTAKACPAGAVDWKADGVAIGQRGCTVHANLDERPHQVSMFVGGKRQATQIVEPKDWLIAAIGDSYGSGEGNPDHPRKVHRGPRDEEPSRWEDKQCHRSATAGISQAAMGIEKTDPYSSVTLLHLSCSGAKIDDGILGTYKGQPPDDRPGDKKRPQIEELQQLLGSRTPDALVISVGGNDIGFSDIIQSCLEHTNCEKKGSGAHKKFDEGIEALPGLYTKLAHKVGKLGVPPAHVFVTGYPDPTHYDDGGLCGSPIMVGHGALKTSFERRPFLLNEAPGVPNAVQIDVDEARWASEDVLGRLNIALKHQAKAHHWTFIDGHVSASKTHGDCARDSWFVSWDEAKARQETFQKKGLNISPGVVHPNKAGHAAYSRAITAALSDIGIPGP